MRKRGKQTTETQNGHMHCEYLCLKMAYFWLQNVLLQLITLEQGLLSILVAF